jgi:GR25 family glycosyltransferase involved in LPS biosynthesis
MKIYNILLILLIIFILIQLNKEDYKDISNKYNLNILLINLKRRPDRLVNFKNKYNLNIPFNVIEAVDGNNLNLEQLYSSNVVGHVGYNSIIKGTRKYHYQMATMGAIGCYLSHIKLWKYIIDNHLEYTLVFEDDCSNNLKINDIYKRLKYIPNDWDILLLSSADSCYLKKKVKKKLYKVNRFFLTHAYIIKYKTAKYLLNEENLFPIEQQIDSKLSDLSNKINIYVYDLKSYLQNNSPTDIQIQDKNTLSYKKFDINDEI